MEKKKNSLHNPNAIKTVQLAVTKSKLYKSTMNDMKMHIKIYNNKRAQLS